MIYQDRIYGKIKIEEPIILEIINTSVFQRLKGINQWGYPNPYFPGVAHTRFEHSLGVFILLKKFADSLEEQIAGLIHDLSHATFSHCIDYVLEAGSEKEHNHQDNVFKKFIRNSEIPALFQKYGLDLDYILNEVNFPLKERPLPDLCADRIDYSLRDAFVVKEIDQKRVDYFLNNMLVEKNFWIFKNFTSAQEYAQLFLKMNNIYYAGLSTAVMFRTVGDYLKYALQKGYISERDFYTTDQQVMDKIRRHSGRDEKLEPFFDRVENKMEFKNDPQDYDVRVFCKSRLVDPLFKNDGEIKRISEVDNKWKKILEKEILPKEYFIKFKK